MVIIQQQQCLDGPINTVIRRAAEGRKGAVDLPTVVLVRAKQLTLFCPPLSPTPAELLRIVCVPGRGPFFAPGSAPREAPEPLTDRSACAVVIIIAVTIVVAGGYRLFRCHLAGYGEGGLWEGFVENRGTRLGVDKRGGDNEGSLLAACVAVPLEEGAGGAGRGGRTH